MREIKVGYEYDGRADQKGYHFEVISREASWILQSKTKHSEMTYEVVKVHKTKKDQYVAGKKVRSEGDEYLAGSNQWGMYGFTYNSWREAIEKLYEMVDKDKEKEDDRTQ